MRKTEDERGRAEQEKRSLERTKERERERIEHKDRSQSNDRCLNRKLIRERFLVFECKSKLIDLSHPETMFPF